MDASRNLADFEDIRFSATVKRVIGCHNQDCLILRKVYFVQGWIFPGGTIANGGLLRFFGSF